MSYHRRPLREGDRIRLESPTSAVRTVKRANLCAAYVTGAPKAGLIKCDDCRALDAKERFVAPCEHCRTFVSTGSVEAISPNALVWGE